MTRSFSRATILGLALAVLWTAACESVTEDSEEGEAVRSGVQSSASASPAAWKEALASALPALGHRNWVVIADSAFPLQISPGIETLVSNEDHFAVLGHVLKAVDGAKHVRPKIHLDEELRFVPEALAPGADAARQRLDEMLEGRNAGPVLHADLIARLDEAGRTFKILMIKTTLAVPYTSVFLELDCGYWGPAEEAKMRATMKAAK
jgi:hypothetical protein